MTRPRIRPLTLAALALVAFGMWSLLQSAAHPTSGPANPCPEESPEVCIETNAEDWTGGDPPGASRPDGPELPASQVCPGAGYLCAELDRTGTVEIRRWREHSGPVVVHVPLPDFESVADARRLQRAAALGVRAWNRQPFPISVDLTGQRPADFSVVWRTSLGGRTLGRARTRWSPATGLEVVQLELATRVPGQGGVASPRQIQLVAAHEMGHALGIQMHSDEPRDVMYPTNTATSLTARDYRTMEALYDLPDGARIVR